jgi:hypothetical protein
MRHRWLVGVALALALASPSYAGNPDVREIILFNGSNTSAAVDTLEQASPWFQVQGAVRVDVRIWSANTSAWTAADSIYADSITTWKVALSDSICCTSVDYYGQTIASAADSLMFDMAIVAANNPDTALAGIACKPLPINKPIAAAKSGSGIISTIYPVTPSWIASNNIFVNQVGIFPKRFMRIRWQPLRRMTEGGRLSTAGIRTRGIRGLKMRAYVYYAASDQ